MINEFIDFLQLSKDIELFCYEYNKELGRFRFVNEYGYLFEANRQIVDHIANDLGSLKVANVGLNNNNIVITMAK